AVDLARIEKRRRIVGGAEKVGQGAQTCQHHGLLPFRQFRETFAEAGLQQIWGALACAPALRGQREIDAALVSSASLTLHQAQRLQTIDDVGDRRLTELQRRRQLGGRYLAATADLLQDQQLRWGQTGFRRQAAVGE